MPAEAWAFCVGALRKRSRRELNALGGVIGRSIPPEMPFLTVFAALSDGLEGTAAMGCGLGGTGGGTNEGTDWAAGAGVGAAGAV